jgi:hypothetical protein
LGKRPLAALLPDGLVVLVVDGDFLIALFEQEDEKEDELLLFQIFIFKYFLQAVWTVQDDVGNRILPLLYLLAPYFAH